MGEKGMTFKLEQCRWKISSICSDRNGLVNKIRCRSWKSYQLDLPPTRLVRCGRETHYHEAYNQVTRSCRYRNTPAIFRFDMSDLYSAPFWLRRHLGSASCSMSSTPALRAEFKQRSRALKSLHNMFITCSHALVQCSRRLSHRTSYLPLSSHCLSSSSFTGIDSNT